MYLDYNMGNEKEEQVLPVASIYMELKEDVAYGTINCRK